jgi:O-acetyl-ADP-ribose deacetylase (regulator of RNase III)
MSTILREHTFPGGQRLEISQGDITQEKVDAIVNAANAHLRHGGGVAAVIVRRGGQVIQQESNAWVRQHGLVPHDQPAYTSAGKLPCRYVIHTVGPVWGEGDEDSKLEAAITGSLTLAEKLKLTSIAFPAISTGIFGFPKDRAAQIFYAAIRSYFEDHPISSLHTVRLTLYDQTTVDAFLQTWDATAWLND